MSEAYTGRNPSAVIHSPELKVFEEFANRPKDSLTTMDVVEVCDLDTAEVVGATKALFERDVLHKVGQRDGFSLYRLNTSKLKVRILAQHVTQYVIDVAVAQEQEALS